MLYIVGVGFSPEHLTREGENAIKKCKRIFAEEYTLIYDFKSLSKLVKKEINILSREEVESGDIILESASKEDTGQQLKDSTSDLHYLSTNCPERYLWMMLETSV